MLNRYIKKLQESLKESEDANPDETQIKVTALKTTSNISTLIRDLFHSPPSFKSKIQLSWISRKMVNINILCCFQPVLPLEFFRYVYFSFRDLAFN